MCLFLPLQSQCSSQEKLSGHQLQHQHSHQSSSHPLPNLTSSSCTLSESLGECCPGTGRGAGGHGGGGGGYYQANGSSPVCTGGVGVAYSSSGYPSGSQQTHPLHPLSHFRLINSGHFSSNDSNPSVLSVDEEGNHSGLATCASSSAGGASCTSGSGSFTGRHSPRMRPRSRSLSSPCRSPGIDNEVVMMNSVYKERFPKATAQMEDRLEKFISENSELDGEAASDAITRFVHHQVLEMAKDCLEKSRDKVITSTYFYEMTENLEKLLSECREKSSIASAHLKMLIKKLLVIVSRPARLLKCLEFDPDEFYRLLEEAEGAAKEDTGGIVKADFPQYVINKLGLTRDPLTDLVGQFDVTDADLNLNKPCDIEKSQATGEANVTCTAATSEGITEDCRRASESSEKPIPATIESTTGSESSKAKHPSDEDYETLKLISNGAYG